MLIKIRLILGVLFVFFPLYSEACAYYINHQSGRFVGSIISQETKLVDVELMHYFKSEVDSERFTLQMPVDSKVEVSDIEVYKAKVNTVHELGKNQDHLWDWFANHYRLVCSYNGVINDWTIKGKGS